MIDKSRRSVKRVRTKTRISESINKSDLMTPILRSKSKASIGNTSIDSLSTKPSLSRPKSTMGSRSCKPLATSQLPLLGHAFKRKEISPVTQSKQNPYLQKLGSRA